MNGQEAYILARAYAKTHSGGDTYTKEEIDEKFSDLESGLEWKDSVATLSDIPTTYPDPANGWTVSADDTGEIYRWNGEEWVNIFSILITPVALTDAEVDALWENASAYMRNIPMTKQSSWNVSASTPTTYAQTDRARITNIIPQKSTEKFVFGMSSAGELFSNVKIRIARFNSDNTTNLSNGEWVDITNSQANLSYQSADSNIVINFMLDESGSSAATITDAILTELQTKFYIKKEAI